MDAIIAMIDMLPFHPSIGVTDNQLSAWPGICTSFAAKDGLFVMQVGREHQFERMANALNKPEWLEDERFKTREGWRDNLDEVIRPTLEAWAAEKTKIEVCEFLASQGIVAGPIFDGDDIVNDPHVKSHDMVLAIDRPDAEQPLHVVGNPVKLSRSTPREVTRWPRLAADTESVLQGDLGVDDAELARLRESGAIR
jgi:crotonobetainyl-CoA:carnitine CoA-transferase CaiB-like acyl-CoA transferase